MADNIDESTHEDEELCPPINCPDCGQTIYAEYTDGGDSGLEPIHIRYRCTCGFCEFP